MPYSICDLIENSKGRKITWFKYSNGRMMAYIDFLKKPTKFQKQCM